MIEQGFKNENKLELFIFEENMEHMKYQDGIFKEENLRVINISMF